MSEAIGLLVGFLQEMPEEEFKQHLKKGDFLKEIIPFLPMLPDDVRVEIKATKFSVVKEMLEKEVPEKASIVEKAEKWKALEETFERLKKKL